jgi:hypothetical protein
MRAFYSVKPRISTTPAVAHIARPEPARKTAGTLQISPEYTASIRVLRQAVLASHAAARGQVKGERVDDVSIEIIDTVPFLDQAARRTLKVVAGQLRRACAGRNGNGHTD